MREGGREGDNKNSRKGGRKEDREARKGMSPGEKINVFQERE